MKKIVVLDGSAVNPGDLSWDELAALGDLTVYDDTETAQVAERVRDAAYVLTTKTPVRAETIAASPELEYIGTLSTGYNQVDIDDAREHGIPVSNIPTYGTRAVAQLAIALLLEVCHHVAAHSEATLDGRWLASPTLSFWEYPLIELDGKTMGILGYGRIGKTAAEIAKALGMKILAEARHGETESDGIAEFTDRESLLARSDVISLHLPLTPDTKDIINRNTIAKMKDGVIIINTARGPLVVEEDMTEALKSGKVYYYATDVVRKEPLRPDNPLIDAPNRFITPHIAWAPKETRGRLLGIAIDNLKAFIEGEPQNVVN